MLEFLNKKLNFLEYKKYGFPKYYRNVWYNYSVYSSGKYPIVFNENKHYIECEIGSKVQMGVTSCGKKVYYKITKWWRERGSDYLFDSDAIKCNMVFSHVSE